MMNQDNIFLLILFSAFAFSAVVQIFYYLWFYLAVILYKHPLSGADKNSVSVIICARNEAENLQKFLPAVLEQDYPDYEVIVVNDCSDDSTYDVLGKYLLKYPHLKVSNVNKDPKFTHNKKFAQFIGIKAARNEILLFTDADCSPESNKWIESMAARFTGKTDFVLGYGGYLPRRGLLNRYIRYDSMTIAMQYLGMAIRGVPYMGVGRNLAYRRSVFFNNKGFGSHYNIISGDDDLFVNSNAGKKNTSVEFRKESHTRSLPCTSFWDWVAQKRRHFTTAPFYKLRDKLLLVTEPASRIIFYLACVILISQLYLWPYTVIIFGIRLIIQIIVLFQVQKRLCEPGMTVYSLLFDIFSPVINGVVYISSKRRRGNGDKWK
jgi:cellulose synthase/poly-beta-1,6-N-acetylglucosamine synthase-like glycosyltransferase